MNDIVRDEHDYLIPVDDVSDEQYRRWNEALGKWFFHAGNDGQPIRLSVDPIVLFECYADCHGEGVFENDEEAQLSFLQAVVAELRSRPVAWKPRRPLKRDQLPDFIGLLCAQVLAVSELGKEASEESIGPNNYWERLQHLLPHSAVNPTSAGFLRMHQELWRSGLERWANIIQMGRWGIVQIPPDKTGSRRHVSLPYSQALLRTTDIQTAMSLLYSRGFRSHREVPLSFLERMFLGASGAPGSISRHACRVIMDETRRPSALEQIKNAFLAWDGTAESLRRSASKSTLRTSELLIGYSRKQSRLSFQIELLKTGETLQVPSAATETLLGPDGTTKLHIGDFAFRPRRRRLLLAVRSPVRGTFITQQKIGIAESGLLLVPQHDVEQWLENVKGSVTLIGQLTSADSGSDIGIPTTGVPSGWAAILFKVGGEKTAVAEPWSYVIDLGRTLMRPVGGAKLDRSTWLAGAGPSIRIEGKSLPTEVDIDGVAHPVHEGNVTAELLSEPGIHVVTVRPSVMEASAPIRITTRHACVHIDRLAITGAWKLDGTAWPVFDEAHDSDESEGACMIGMQLVGIPPKFKRTACHNAQRLAIELLIGRSLSKNVTHTTDEHPIVQSLMIRSRMARNG